MYPEDHSRELNFEALSEKELEFIHAVEQLLLPPGAKVSILLAFSGRKPVSFVDIEARRWPLGATKPEMRPEVTNRVNELTRLLEGIGLSVDVDVHESEPHADGDTIERFNFIISKDPSFVVEMKKEARQYHVEQMNNRAVGLLLGYPPSAVEAFCHWRADGGHEENRKEYLLSVREIPDDSITREDYASFVTYFLSKDNWREELESARVWSKTVLALSPNIHLAHVQHNLIR